MDRLRIVEVCKVFSTLPVLDHVSLTVEAGECLALVGPSGCGKTTLLRIIAGLEAATAGSIHLGAIRVDHLPPHQRDVALLFQRPALVPQHTVRQNLAWTWTLRQTWPGSLDPKRETDLVRLARDFGLEADLDRPAQQLSGGQQQRLALGRCLLRQARFCLLDEPFASLDAVLRIELRRQVRDMLRQRQTTTLVVTHDPAEAFALGDRIAVLHAGQLVQVDTPEVLSRQPRHLRVAELACHDRGGLNLLRGTLNEATFAGPFGSWRLDANFSINPRILPSKDHFVPIIIGIPADRVTCSEHQSSAEDSAAVPLCVLSCEAAPQGNWVIAGDARGQVIGRADGRLPTGQRVTMTFSLRDSFGFDGATGLTLWTPG